MPKRTFSIYLKLPKTFSPLGIAANWGQKTHSSSVPRNPQLSFQPLSPQNDQDDFAGVPYEQQKSNSGTNPLKKGLLGGGSHQMFANCLVQYATVWVEPTCVPKDGGERLLPNVWELTCWKISGPQSENLGHFETLWPVFPTQIRKRKLKFSPPFTKLEAF